MIVDRISFDEILKKCFPIVEQKSSLYNANFDCFLFKDGFIHAYNNYMSISVKLLDDFDIDYMLINAKILKGVFDKMKGKEIELLFLDNELKIKDGNMTAKTQSVIAVENGYDIDSSVKILNDILKKAKWKKIPDNFFQALNFCLVPSSCVSSTFQLGVGVEEDDMFDAAGTSMSWFRLTEKMDSFFLSEDGVKNILKIEGLKRYFVSENWVHFCSDDGGVFFNVRLIDYKLPIQGCFRIRDEHLEKGNVFNGFLPETLNEVLDRALLFIEKTGNLFSVKIKFDKNGLTVNAKKGSNEFEEFLSWEDEIEPFEEFSFFVNVKLLQFGLRERLMFSFCDRSEIKRNNKLSFTNHIDRLYCFKEILKKF
jgi:hypothetical protein